MLSAVVGHMAYYICCSVYLHGNSTANPLSLPNLAEADLGLASVCVI